MEMKKVRNLIAVGAICGLMLTNCSKDNNPSPATGFTSAQTDQVENSDVQDAVANQIDEDVDNTADELQNGSYQVDDMSSARVMGGSRTITVDHPDSTTFPKLVTIIYVNWSDSTADERFVKNGEIDIIVNTSDPNHQLITREYTFKNFSVTTDSTVISVSGTRTVEREHDSIYWDLAAKKARMEVSDHITANLSYSVTTIGGSDASTFTRIVDKTRDAICWYRVAFLGRHLFGWHIASSDTVTFTGKVTGINENGEAYDKEITQPVVAIAYRGTLVLTAGTVDLTGGSSDSAYSYEITFAQDLPDHPHKTLVTVTNTLTGNSISFERRLSRRFIKW